MQSKINQVPVIGALEFDLVKDSGRICIRRPGNEPWEEKGTVSALVEELMSRVDTDSQAEMREFLGRVHGGEILTISPVTIQLGADAFTVGLSVITKRVGLVELSVFDLGGWIAGRAKAEKVERVNSTYLRIMEWIKASLSDAESWQHILNEFIELSENKFGFVGKRELDETGAPYLKTTSLTNIAWDDATQKLYQEQAASGFEFRNLRALFGPTIEHGETVVSRDYKREKRGVGIPAGHPPLESYVGIPIKIEGRVLGMIGMAGKPGGCSEDCVSSITGVMNLLSQDERFLRLFDDKHDLDVASGSESFEAMLEIIDRVEFPGVHFDGDKITWASVGAAKMFGCLSGMLVGLDLSVPDNIIGLREEKYKQDDPDSLGAVMDKSRSNARDRWVSTPSGSRRSFFYLKYMIVAGRELYQVIDYTMQAQAMRETQEFARKAAEVSQLQSRLVNMISHELRTPLSSLQTSVELVEMSTSGELRDQLGPYFDNIYHMVGQMTSHIDSVLTFGKVTTGQDQIVLHPTKLDSVVESVLSELQSEAVDRVRLEYSGCEPGVVLLSDQALLGLAMRNIISNALKFSDGLVHVTVSSEESVSGVVSLTIRDHGVGIPPEDLVKVFEPFYRSSNVSRFPGTGIGLALVKGIVRVLKGQIRLSSTTGKGTKVTMNLPSVAP